MGGFEYFFSYLARVDYIVGLSPVGNILPCYFWVAMGVTLPASPYVGIGAKCVSASTPEVHCLQATPPPMLEESPSRGEDLLD